MVFWKRTIVYAFETGQISLIDLLDYDSRVWEINRRLETILTQYRLQVIECRRLPPVLKHGPRSLTIKRGCFERIENPAEKSMRLMGGSEMNALQISGETL